MLFSIERELLSVETDKPMPKAARRISTRLLAVVFWPDNGKEENSSMAIQVNSGRTKKRSL
jgi:hypothetical protein